MKGRHRTAAIITALAMLFISMAGFSKDVRTQPKQSSARSKKAKSTRQAVRELNSDNAYVVRRGDNLIQIARAHQVTLKALKASNGLKSSRIKAGQKLRIPDTQNAAAPRKTPPKTSVQTAANAETATYISQLKDQNPASDEESQLMRLRLVEAGFKMIGIRYRRSGGSESTGFDCSGLVKNLFSRFDIDLPRTSREQFRQGEKIDRDKLEVGDLVFFSSGGKNPTHVGIYVGDDKFLHAARKARQVIVSDLSKIWYTMRYLGARRISDLWGDETANPQPEPQQ